MTEHYPGIDVHKTESQVAVIDEVGEVIEERRVANEELDALAQEYAGGNAAIEATSNYFTIYDTLEEHLDVTLANPVKADWLAGQKQKTDRVDAKQLARFLRLDEVPESYVPSKAYRRYRALARGRKKLVNKRTDFKNEVTALLDQTGVRYDGRLWTDEGRAFLAALTLEEPYQLLLDQWLAAVDEFTEKIKRLQQRIEAVATEIEGTDLLMTAPGIAAFSSVMILSELGDVERFDRSSDVMSYAGLDPVVRESGETRTEHGISKEGNGYLRWILVQSAIQPFITSRIPI